MHSFLRGELKQLMGEHEGPCVSIYLPTDNGTEKFTQAPIRLKNLLAEAEEQLAQSGMRPRELAQMLEPAQKAVEDRFFWRHSAQGLAFFLTPRAAYHYRLPIPFDELAVVTHRFHLKPLLPLLSGDGEFYLLALSQNEVRVMHGSRFRIEELDAGSLPRNLADAMKYDDIEKQFQFRSAAPSGQGKGSLFHGHGVADDDKDRILRYFRQIDSGLQELLGDKEAPLVLAGVEYLIPIYKAANTYAHTLSDAIPGNPEESKPDELHQRAWAIVEPRFTRARESAVAQYQELADTDRTTDSIRDIAPASQHARIETLFVAVGEQEWGRVNPETGNVQLAAGDRQDQEDLLDYAAIQTYVNGGTVYAVRPEAVPADAPAAAILRW